MTDEEDSESEFDPDDVLQQLEGMKQLLQRHVGIHKDIGNMKGMEEHWPNVNPAQYLTLEGEDSTQTIKLVNAAEESEKKRRMSVPFTDSLADATDLRETSDHVTSMQEELLHLFAIHDAKFEEECERERRAAEAAKEGMQEELVRKASLRRTHEAFEEERQRRIQAMETFLSEESEDSMAMADTNARLSLVHDDLKHAFRIMEKANEKKESQQRHSAEESKEMVLQEIRRRPVKKKHKEEFELTKQQKIQEYNERKRLGGDELDRTLVRVQEDLLKIFGKLKSEKKMKKEKTLIDQLNRKVMMHEELMHKTIGKQVAKLEAEEKTRRIKEFHTGEITEEDRQRQKTMDMLLEVQKQLLDVMSSCQSTRMNNHGRRLSVIGQSYKTDNVLST